MVKDILFGCKVIVNATLRACSHRRFNEMGKSVNEPPKPKDSKHQMNELLRHEPSI